MSSGSPPGPRSSLRDVLAPLLLGAGAALLLHVARALSEPRRTVPDVTDVLGAAVAGSTVEGAVQDAVLFELEELVQEPSAPQPPTPAPGWAAALGVFDLETTGIDTATARIVTAHVGVIDEFGQVVERHEWIVDPGVPIPEGATAVHGVSTERAQRFGRRPAEVVPEILAAIRSVLARGFPLVVYNAPYDLTLLTAEALRVGVPPLDAAAPVVDPFVIDKALDRYRKGKRTLGAVAPLYGVQLTDAHEAGADAIAAGRVAQAMARRFGPELAISAAELHEAQVGWCADQADRFQRYMRQQRDAAYTASGAWPHR